MSIINGISITIPKFTARLEPIAIKMVVEDVHISSFKFKAMDYFAVNALAMDYDLSLIYAAQVLESEELGSPTSFKALAGIEGKD